MHRSVALDRTIAIALEQARRDEQAGYTALYRLLAGKVSGYVRGRGVLDTDDVVNEVFLGAFQRLPSFRGSAGEFRSWLFTIAHHKSTDWLRAAARRPVLAREAIDLADVGPVGDAERDALARLGHDVTSLLAVLTPEQRDVILLRIVGDLSLAEVATPWASRSGPSSRRNTAPCSRSSATSRPRRC